MATIKGSLIVEQPMSHTWSRSQGFRFFPAFEGVTSSALSTSAAYRAAGVPYSFIAEGATARIVATQAQPPDGTVERPVGNWQLIGNAQQKDIRESVAFRTTASDADRLAILSLIKGNLTDPPADVTPPFDTPQGEELYRMVYQGQQHYKYTQWTLRHSMTVSQAWTTALSGSNLDKVFTTAQLLAECATFDDPLPPLLIAEVNNIPAPAAITRYLWGWLKEGPQFQTVAGDLIQCDIEYTLEQWATDLYDAAT